MPNFMIVPTPTLVPEQVPISMREFAGPDWRISHPNEEPPAKCDDKGNPLVTVDMVFKQEAYGKVNSVVRPVSMPKNMVDPEIELGFYLLLEPVVSVFVDKKSGQLRESWSSQGMVPADGSLVTK